MLPRDIKGQRTRERKHNKIDVTTLDKYAKLGYWAFLMQGENIGYEHFNSSTVYSALKGMFTDKYEQQDSQLTSTNTVCRNPFTLPRLYHIPTLFVLLR